MIRPYATELKYRQFKIAEFSYFLIVTWLKPQHMMHKRIHLSYFFAKRIGLVQGDYLS